MLNLKAGDKVLMRNTWRTDIGIVDKITPTGIIKVDGYSFRPDGRERGGDSYHPWHIEPLTPELEVEFYKKRFISKVANSASDYDFRNMSYDIAKALNELLGLQIKE